MGFTFDKNTALDVGKSVQRSSVITATKSTLARNKEATARKDSSLMRSESNAAPKFGSVPLDIDLDPLLEGMAYDTDDKQLFNIYRDIYYFDPVGGSYVDMTSTLPFSEFTLGGAKDSVLEPYYETCERLRIGAMMPSINTDMLVTGAHVSSMLYNKEKKSFLDLMCHRYDDINVTPLPFNNQDPILDWKVPKETRDALSHESERVKKLREYIGTDLCQKIDSGETIELNSLGTLYLPRRQFTTGPGVSVFRRLLPVWLIEKNLYRGTIIESGRRQRGIIHAQLGDGGEWEPTLEEMQAVTDLLQSADSDPIGAVIATRLGVSINEFRQGGDFWKITDIWDQTSQYKLRALGASEALLSGDATFSNGETGLMAFLESLAASRAALTRQLFYQKLFPLVSIIHGMAINRQGMPIRKANLAKGDMMDVMTRMQDGSRLFIPTVHWNKRLKPEVDQGQMDVLRAMTDLGVPVSLRAIAAAGGMNLNQILADQDENLAIQRKLMDYKRRMDEINKQMGGGDSEGGGGGGGSFSSADPRLQGSVLGGRRRLNMFDRNWDAHAEMYERTATGKKKHVFRQKIAQDRANENIYKAMRKLANNKSTSLSSGTVSHTPANWEAGALSRLPY